MVLEPLQLTQKKMVMGVFLIPTPITIGAIILMQKKDFSLQMVLEVFLVKAEYTLLVGLQLVMESIRLD